MRKLVVVLAVAGLAIGLMLVGASAASAGSGKPCPHDRNEAGAPNCGNKKKPPPPPEPPAGNCAEADLVLLRDVSEEFPPELLAIVCVYTTDPSQASTEEDCPDADITTHSPGQLPPEFPVGVCVFLPSPPEGAALTGRL
jgi:hypothetical protein